MTCACTIAGPLRWRHHSAARRTASYDRIGSLPSTSSSNRLGKLRTSLDTEPPAVWTSIGTEMAYLLSSMRNRTGSLRLLALFSASHHSPSLVVPSPAEQYTISSPWIGFSVIPSLRL